MSINHTKFKAINEILNHLELLKRKYGGSMASVEEYYYYIQAQEEKTGSNNEEIQRLDSENIVLEKFTINFHYSQKKINLI